MWNTKQYIFGNEIFYPCNKNTDKKKKTWTEIVHVRAVRTHLVVYINRFGVQFKKFKRGQTSSAYDHYDLILWVE